MNFRVQIRSWTSAMLRRNRTEREMDEEMRFHLEARATDLMRDGLAEHEALRRARLEFGAWRRPKISVATQSV